jgi:CheY-like chemotaxis protein
MGMSEEFMERMYESFSRQTDSRVNSVQGTGLGLAITKQMVDLMEGTIECQSKEGEGTTFTVTLDLPIAEHEDEGAVSKSSNAPASDGDQSDIAGMHVLVAEDNDINWEILFTLLDMYGIQAERAENGQVAVDMLASAEPGAFDLVLMDVQMPVMNGLEATKAIRALPDEWASTIPIIATTADAFSEDVAACMDAGMNGHIAKPIDIKLVLKEMRRVKEGKL